MWPWIKLGLGVGGIVFIVRFWLRSPFKDAGLVEGAILRYGGDTPWGLLITLLLGIGLTCLVHSSSLATWVMISMVASGLIPIHTGIAFIMGANLGTCIDAYIATWIFQSHEATMVAYSHILFNTIGICIMFPLFLIIRHWIK